MNTYIVLFFVTKECKKDEQTYIVETYKENIDYMKELNKLLKKWKGYCVGCAITWQDDIMKNGFDPEQAYIRSPLFYKQEEMPIVEFLKNNSTLEGK